MIHPRRTPLFRGLLFIALVLVGLDLAATLAWAGPVLADGPSFATRAFLFVTGMLTEIVNDRARLIQASVFIVTLGVALLWWRK